MQDFSNQDHQSNIARLRDFHSPDRRPSIYQLFEEDHRCSFKLSNCVTIIVAQLGTVVSDLVRLCNQTSSRETANTELANLAIACRNAARDCRRYIQLIERMENEPTEEPPLEGLDAELENLRLLEITNELQRRLKEITDDLPVPQFD